MTNLIYHYQTVVHPGKDSIYIHEAFSTRSGQLYMVNPVPAEVSADSEEEIELCLRAMEVDSTKYRAVNINSIIPQLERWQDEVDVHHEFVEPTYEDEDDLELDDDYLDTSGEVIDLVDYINRYK